MKEEKCSQNDSTMELAKLAEAARGRKDYCSAYDFAVQALRNDGTLTQAWLELSIAAYYVGEMDQGLKYANELMVHQGIGNDVKKMTRNNATYYYKPLSHYAPSTTLHHLTLTNLDPMRRATNPSVCTIDTAFFKGYLVAMRTVNYLRDLKTHRFSLISGNHILSQTFLVLLDEEFQPLGQSEVTAKRWHSPSTFWKGIEDARAFIADGYVWLACCFPDSSSVRKARTGLIEVGALQAVIEKVRANQAIHAPVCYTLRGPVVKRNEKNWVPVVRGRRILSIYSFSPTVVLEADLTHPDLDADPGTRADFETPMTEIQRAPTTRDYSTFRGGSCAVPWKSGESEELLVVHEVDDKLRYTHRFVEMCGDQRVVRVSLPFFFTELGIEFCSGLAYSLDGQQLLISFGLHDTDAKYVSVSVTEIKSFLERYSTRE